MRTTNTLTPEELTQALKKHPLTQNIMKDAEAKEATRLQRIETVKRLKELHQEKEDRLSSLRKTVDEKRGDADKAKEVWSQKERAWSDAMNLLNGEASHINREINKAKAFLKATGPIELIERIEFLKKEREKLPRKSSRQRTEQEILQELRMIDDQISELENKLLEAEVN